MAIDKEALAKSMAAEIVKYFEGLKLTPYICPGGYVSVGWGHKILPGEEIKEITEKDAEKLLNKDIDIALNGLKMSLSQDIFNRLGVNQIAALLDLIFNIGIGAFRASTLRRKLLDGNSLREVAKEFEKWVYINGEKNSGLIKRREAEQELFLSGVKDDN